MKTVYFDNAATSWPKPEEVLEAMSEYSLNTGASPGRSGHSLSIEAGRIVLDTRIALSGLFGINDPLRIVFTKNATEALNIATLGLLKKGDHCITSCMEHNSLMRPLRHLESQGVSLSAAPCSAAGELDPDEIKKLIRPETKAVYMTHASNVTGDILPVMEAGKIAKEHGLVFCVDAAQSAGALPINTEEMNMDLLAFTGHKSLFGPQGTGGLFIRKGLEERISPISFGGTGSRSEFEMQPDFMPDKFESGTPNTIGIAGLNAGVNFLIETGIAVIRKKEERLVSLFMDGLEAIDGAKIFGAKTASKKIGVVSFSINGISPSELALELDEKYGIMSRPGLHCAPLAHKSTGTFPGGTLRFSFSFFNTDDEILYALEALSKIAASKRK